MKTAIKQHFYSRQNWLFLALVFLLIPLSAIFHPVFGQAGSLDPSFDGDGIVTTPVGSAYEGAYSILLQPDGKIIAAGYSNSGTFDYDFAVVRYNTDGSLDNTFSNDGKVTTDFGSINDYATSALLQPDGKIILCGRTYINGNYDYGCALARYNTDGSLDTSFDGDGKVIYNINTMDEIILECALQADGKILVAGYSYIGSQSVFAVLRFNTTGSLDNTFGAGGLSVITFGASQARCSDVIVLSGGQILTVGRVFISSITGSSDFALAQLSSNGQLDNTFGVGGKVTTDFSGVDDYGETFAIQPDGKIIAAGYTGNILTVTEFAMARYTAAGGLDNTFGVNGKVTTAFTTHDEAYAIALQPDAKILLAGRVFNGYNDFGIARYLNNGVIDSTFDSDGRVMVPIGNNHDEAFSLALQADGKIIAGGRSENADDDFALIRLRGDIMTGLGMMEDAEVLQSTFVFPNPAINRLNLHNISANKKTIKIYDLSGREVYAASLTGQREFQINIESLEAGTFLCQVSDGQQSQTLLFTKIKF